MTGFVGHCAIDFSRRKGSANGKHADVHAGERLPIRKIDNVAFDGRVLPQRDRRG